MFLINQAMVNVPIGTAALIVVLGMAVVFFGLILLMLVTKASGKIMQNKEAAAKAAAPAPAPAAPAAPAVKAVAPGSAGEVKLHDVPDRTAAMLMAIVADKLGKPLNELRAPHNALCAVRFLSRFLYSAPVFCSASAKRVGAMPTSTRQITPILRKSNANSPLPLGRCGHRPLRIDYGHLVRGNCLASSGA